jgi:cytosine permease
MAIQEFEHSPVSPEQLQPARYFAASYAGEHVAGTEFVIGAMFVAWGVGTGDILSGLLLGNTLAVLTWALICAPIAVDTRLTLYAYLEKIAGPGTIKLYSLVNGLLFCVLAGAMITVSASAVRIIFDVPAQVNWYPSSMEFVYVALGVGAVVVAIAVKGFRRVAQFSEVCAPWMILMFFAGALALLPELAAHTPGINSIGSVDDFLAIANTHIWVESDGELGFWHVAAFAWVCNLAMHGGLSDMTVLRFARRSSYGYFSALGMFIGHFAAWICAGIMGAAAALVLKTTVSALDPGEVAFQALGAAGIVAVIIAGWTTSNPTIYRAGLAFQSLNPKWNRATVTIITGIVTTIIACFPFVFTKLLDFVGLMGLMLAPIGAVIVTEHWLFPRLGLTRYWAHYAGLRTNWAAIIAWVGTLLAALLMHQMGLHLFFLLLPSWAIATVIYLLAARMLGASVASIEASNADDRIAEQRKQTEQKYLQTLDSTRQGVKAIELTGLATLAKWIALASLAACLIMSLACYAGSLSLESFRAGLLWPSLAYFVSATYWMIGRERTEDNPLPGKGGLQS